jgi:dTDP-4-dehydrorhamnose 3,5-epimerase
MNIKKTFIKDLFVIEPVLFFDKRGHFFESYNKNKLLQIFNLNFVQDNESESNLGVIRGLHFQVPPCAQAKLVRCVSGKILDVAVDIRKKSKTYGKVFSIELSSKNKKQLFIPKGFAHGFQALSNRVIVSYKADNYYDKSSESGIIWNDKDLNIQWVLKNSNLVSEKDSKLPFFSDFESPF